MKKQQEKCKPISSVKKTARVKKVITKEEDFGPVMYQFTCEVCKRRLFDTKRYFGEKATKVCLWCTKFPNKDKKR
jgi:hypothetical protein